MNKAPFPKDLVFPLEEYQSRISGLRRQMHEQGLDALLVFTAENTFYLCGYQSIGYSSFQCLIVPQEGPLSLLVREMEQGCAEYYSILTDNVLLYSDHQDPVEVLTAALAERGFREPTDRCRRSRAIFDGLRLQSNHEGHRALCGAHPRIG